MDLKLLETKVNLWLSNKYNLYFLIIFIFAFAVRLYYLFLTKNQALWWDEAEYLNMAKHWAFSMPYDLNPQRPPLFPLLAAAIFSLSGGVFAAKLLLSLVPSVLIVFLTYIIAGEFYGKKAGLVASAFMALFWFALFNTVRSHTDLLAMLFSSLAIYFVWKHAEQQKNWMMVLAGLLIGLSVLTRLLAGITVIILAIFLLIAKRRALFFDKYIWFSGLAAAVFVLPYLIWAKLHFGNILAPFSGYESAFTGISNTFAWHVFGFFKWFGEWPIFILFLAGCAMVLTDIVLGRELVFKQEGRMLRANALLLVWVFTYVFYFVFIVKAYTTEDRWLLPITIPMFILAARPVIAVFDFLKKYNRSVALASIAVLLVICLYPQYAHAAAIIPAKANTYAQEPWAGQWLKENTQPSDVIMSVNEQAPLAFYSERRIYGLDTPDGTVERIKKFKPKYFVVTGYAKADSWQVNFPEKYKYSIVPAHAFFEDPEHKQLAIIIYKFSNYDLNPSTANSPTDA
ncbi:MAG: glycosyltransferase family 39 protein [DPANN group archaeon]|nr:glycosyltransferase family 39 protein [DPANN group archaeon]